MSTANIGIPSGVERIILTLDHLDEVEVQRLRIRVEDVEKSNSALTGQVARLQANYDDLKARYTDLEAEVERIRGMLQRGQHVPASPRQYPYRDEDRGILVLGDESMSRKFLVEAKKNYGVQRKNIIMAKDETHWLEFPNVGFSVKPDRVLSKKGHWQEGNRQLLRRFLKVEVLTRLEGKWLYLGTYQNIGIDPISPEEFRTLPDKVRKALVAQSGHKSNRNVLRDVLEAGELGATKFTLKRVAFNDTLATRLVEALQALHCLPVQLEAAQPADNDGSDDSDADTPNVQALWW
ncbi:hypothetical protein EVJ58_g1572 [Rhodofomes roseus]|uniref:DUF6697 domain-containing protein n=1 Tax=Rhodofomes roseus TaxID=34475 RepID=A0A4Y9YYS8_9APHY|nr:hypothetical protein EVJ58_g1572 [Rhodofomes roseus]